MPIQLEMPRLSESLTEGTIVKWLKNVNDHVEIGDPVAEIETNKANIQLLAEYDGCITKILAAEGSRVQTGDPIVMFERDQTTPYTSTPAPREKKTVSKNAKASPLAKKLAIEKAIDMYTVHGTGPHGRIMARDIISGKVKTAVSNKDFPIARKASQENRIMAPASKISNFYVYTFEANMSQLAGISTPIAVQSEKFLGGRYCLFDYVARAAVKAFSHVPSALNDQGNMDTLMILNSGNKDIPLPNAVKKTIYDIAINRNVGKQEQATAKAAAPTNYKPDLLVCDAGVQMSDLATRIKDRPRGVVILGGASPKANIEAGLRTIPKIMLPITIYIDAGQMGEEGTTQIAAEFKSLMENPVLLLF